MADGAGVHRHVVLNHTIMGRRRGGGAGAGAGAGEKGRKDWAGDTMI